MTEYPECQSCPGWCCINIGIVCKLTDESILRIASYLELPYQQFKDEYTIMLFGKRTFKYTRPCRFLQQGLCAIHEVKPEGCANWPVNVSRDCGWWPTAPKSALQLWYENPTFHEPFPNNKATRSASGGEV